MWSVLKTCYSSVSALNIWTSIPVRQQLAIPALVDNELTRRGTLDAWILPTISSLSYHFLPSYFWSNRRNLVIVLYRSLGGYKVVLQLHKRATDEIKLRQAPSLSHGLRMHPGHIVWLLSVLWLDKRFFKWCFYRDCEDGMVNALYIAKRGGWGEKSGCYWLMINWNSLHLTKSLLFFFSLSGWVGI